jgi:hypothetical protein
MHNIDVSFDGVGYGASGSRLAVWAGKFASEIMGEVLNALQAPNQRGVW